MPETDVYKRLFGTVCIVLGLIDRKETLLIFSPGATLTEPTTNTDHLCRRSIEFKPNKNYTLHLSEHQPIIEIVCKASDEAD